MKKKYGHKVSKSLKKYYQTDKYLLEDKTKRYEKISNTRKVKLNTKELELLHAYIKAGYIRNLKILASKVTKRYSYKAILNEFKADEKLKQEFYKGLSGLPSYVQNLNLEEWEEVKKLIISGEYLKLKKLYNIGEKSRQRIEKTLPEIKNRKFANKRETNPERIIREILQDLQIDFNREVYINNNKWVLDFLVFENLAIEVHGDYWHVNPRIKFNKINKVQLKNQINDLQKKEWLLQNNYNLLVIWETDIYTNLEKIKILLHDYITKRHFKNIYLESF